ncbi:TniB family NTP-binding protein [Vibrio sp. THAF190c]|uniref:TniB family NTP-binding protein n=1 Tax=Vibrio sp. THAF190c TaxID=2587865 RepID=UPI001268D03F|nr:TniB family NTP-binding protein [Vibrio sp. THAF190c]QFT11219.1 Bacterial TniB protein [Vibrio sp. THAF190c]
MKEFSHLQNSCTHKLQWSVEERVTDILRPRWIGYDSAQTILRRFDDIYRHPRVSRMPNVMLIGRTNNGKTELIKKFCRKYQSDPDDLPAEGFSIPIMYMQAPPTPNEGDLYSEILSSLYERVPSSSVAAKRKRVVDVLRMIDLKVICIDELHNSLAGSSIKRQSLLNALKYLGNELQISFIASGTEDLLRTVSIDNQIQNRFEPILLPKWKMGKEFRQLLKTFESIIPLREPSNLHTQALSQKILSLSEGAIGEVSTLLNKAAIYSLRHGEEIISSSTLSKCGYIPPSDRIRDTASGI